MIKVQLHVGEESTEETYSHPKNSASYSIDNKYLDYLIKDLLMWHKIGCTISGEIFVNTKPMLDKQKKDFYETVNKLVLEQAYDEVKKKN